MLEWSKKGDKVWEMKSDCCGLREVLSRKTAVEEEWRKRSKTNTRPEVKVVVFCSMIENLTIALREGATELIKGLCSEDKAKQLPWCEKVN